MPPISSTISGNAEISKGSEIFANAKIVIKKFIDVFATVDYAKSQVKNFFSEIAEVLDPVPSAPTALIATDLATGDSIRLDWTTSGAPAYNVFKSTGGPFTKVNQIVLGSGETTYIVGGLTTGVSHSFIVRGVNGQGAESSDSNTAVATPTLNLGQSKFTKPTWLVNINSSEDAAILLEQVRISYGSDFSKATFTKIEQNASLSIDNNVEVIANGRSIFKGKIKNITSSISSGGLRQTYTALSNLLELTKTTVKRNKNIGTTFNTREDLRTFLDAFTLSRIGLNTDSGESLGKSAELTGKSGASSKSLSQLGMDFPFVVGKINADELLLKILGYIPIGAPTVFPGAITITDQTPLQAVETVLRQVGNFKIVFNDLTNRIEIYQIGSGGKFQRTLEVGKHVITSNLTTSTSDIVTKVTIISAPVVIGIRKNIPSFGRLIKRRNSDGNFVSSTQLGGNNIGNITVEGFQNSPPDIVYDGQRQALPKHVGLTDGYWPGGADPTTGEPLPRQEAGFRPAIVKISNFKPSYKPLAAEVRYVGRDTATVLLGELPKIWSVATSKARVPRFVGTFEFEVVTEFEFRQGALRLFYEFEQNPLEVSAGVSGIDRVITDTGYRPGTVSGTTSIAQTQSDMQQRADAELARLSHVQQSGNITVLGDETFELRTVVNGMDVLSITHNFTRGFTTTLQLTNELAIFEVIPDPADNIQGEQQVVRRTRPIVDVHTFDIIFIDIDGKRNNVTPTINEQGKPDFGPRDFNSVFGA